MTASLSHRLVDGIEDAVDKRGRFGGGKLFGQLDGFVDHHFRRRLGGVAQFIGAQPQDVAVNRRHAVQAPVPGMLAEQAVERRRFGDGTFKDVSGEAGLRKDGKGLGVIVVDIDDDRRLDIYVANDTVDNFLYLNRSKKGKIVLEEVGLPAGVARDDRGMANGSMGVAAADYDGSGRPSIWVTNYENEMHALYRNQGSGFFLFNTPASGIARIGQKYVGFGTGFLDIDNDGWEDLAIANGHVIRHPQNSTLCQRPVLLQNLGKGRFEEITSRGGRYFQTDHLGRGLALGDIDNDGRIDIVVSHLNEPVVLLRNESKSETHWLGVELARSMNRDLAGAKITVEVAGRRATRFAMGGGSYLSAGDPRHVFGLGPAKTFDRITVVWPSGHEQQWEGLTIDHYWQLIEGEKAARPVRARSPGG